MTNEEAIKAIMLLIRASDGPSENYYILREALMHAIEEQPPKSCSYYAENDKKPCCIYDCEGCIWCVQNSKS